MESPLIIRDIYGEVLFIVDQDTGALTPLVTYL